MPATLTTTRADTENRAETVPRLNSDVVTTAEKTAIIERDSERVFSGETQCPDCCAWHRSSKEVSDHRYYAVSAESKRHWSLCAPCRFLDDVRIAEEEATNKAREIEETRMKARATIFSSASVVCDSDNAKAFFCDKGHELPDADDRDEELGQGILTNCEGCDGVVCLECGKAILTGTRLAKSNYGTLWANWERHYYYGMSAA